MKNKKRYWAIVIKIKGIETQTIVFLDRLQCLKVYLDLVNILQGDDRVIKIFIRSKVVNK